MTASGFWKASIETATLTGWKCRFGISWPPAIRSFYAAAHFRLEWPSSQTRLLPSTFGFAGRLIFAANSLPIFSPAFSILTESYSRFGVSPSLTSTFIESRRAFSVTMTIPRFLVRIGFVCHTVVYGFILISRKIVEYSPTSTAPVITPNALYPALTSQWVLSSETSSVRLGYQFLFRPR